MQGLFFAMLAFGSVLLTICLLCMVHMFNTIARKVEDKVDDNPPLLIEQSADPKAV